MTVLEIIKQIQADKIAKKIESSHVLYVEISRFQTAQLKEELDNLVRENILETGDTLNDKYYKIK